MGAAHSRALREEVAMNLLPTEWGTDADWRSKTVGDTTTYLRVTDFANSDDARRFNEWADRGYFLQKGCDALRNSPRPNAPLDRRTTNQH